MKFGIDSPQFKNEVGNKYGKLTVIEFGGMYKSLSGSTGALWKCQCDCGNKKVILGKSLRRKITVSCGCWHGGRKKGVSYPKKAHKHKNIVGKRFGKLLVLRQVDDYIRSTEKTMRIMANFECRCDCGNIVNKTKDSLMHRTYSCGCLKESWIAHQAKIYFKVNYDAVVEYSDVVNPKTRRPLRYDIFIPNKNIYIEINGLQHYEIKNTYHKTIEQLNYDRFKDSIKRNNAKQRGTYIEVDLRKIKTPEQAIEYIESRIGD